MPPERPAQTATPYLKMGRTTLHGDHVSRRLHLAGAVDQQGGRRQGHPHTGVDRHHGGLGKLIGPAVRSLGPGYSTAQFLQRGEPGHSLLGGAAQAVVAVEKQVEHRVHQRADDSRQAVQHPVEDRQGQQMAGEHGTEDGKGVEEEAGGGLDQQPYGQRLQIQTVPHSLAGQGEAKDGGVGQQQEAEPGQIVGEKQSLPPQGRACIMQAERLASR